MENISDVVGNIKSVAMSSQGYKSLLSKVDHITPEELDTIISEVASCCVLLSKDRYAHQIVEVLFEKGSPKQYNILLKSIINRVAELALDNCGSQVLQKVVEISQEGESLNIIKEFKGAELDITMDPHGSKVVQTYLNKFDLIKLEPLISTWMGHGAELAASPSSYNLIPFIIDKADTQKEIDLVSPILIDVVCSVRTMARDPYGSKVVQHILQHAKPSPQHQNQILQRLLELDDVLLLSQNRYASHVVERMFECASERDQWCIMNELIAGLPSVLSDRYSNLVVQKLLVLCRPEMRSSWEDAIQPHIHTLSKCNIARNVLETLSQITSNSEFAKILIMALENKNIKEEEVDKPLAATPDNIEVKQEVKMEIDEQVEVNDAFDNTDLTNTSST